MNQNGSDCFEYDLHDAYRHGNVWERVFHAIRFREVLHELPSKDAAILDYGCNTGFILVELARRGFGVDGYDISPRNIARAERYAMEAGVRTKLYLRCLPDTRWDEILLINVLEYAIDKERLVDDVDRHLARDGRILVGWANPWHPIIRFSRLRGMLSGRGIEDIKKSEPANPLQRNELLALFRNHHYQTEFIGRGFLGLNEYFRFYR